MFFTLSVVLLPPNTPFAINLAAAFLWTFLFQLCNTTTFKYKLAGQKFFWREAYSANRCRTNLPLNSSESTDN